MHQQICYHLARHTLNRSMDIEQQLNRIQGVRAYLNIASHQATIRYNPKKINELQLRQTIQSAGGKIVQPIAENILLHKCMDEYIIEMSDLATATNITAAQAIFYAGSLLKPLPVGKVIAKIANQNQIELKRAKHVRHTDTCVTGIIQKISVACTIKDSLDTPRLYFTANDESIAYLAFTLTRIR